MDSERRAYGCDVTGFNLFMSAYLKASDKANADGTEANYRLCSSCFQVCGQELDRNSPKNHFYTLNFDP